MKFIENLCIGCGACEQACLSGIIKMENGLPVLAEGCSECGACERGCPAGALQAEEMAAADQDSTRFSGYWVVGFEPQSQPALSKVTLELLSAAHGFAEKKPAPVVLLVCGSELSERWRADASGVGCDEILIMEGKTEGGIMSFWTEAVTRAVHERRPEVLLFPAIADGRDLAPKVACRLRTGLTADCTDLQMGDDGNLLQIRPTYGGNILATICTPNHRPQMATVRPNVMKIAQAQTPADVKVTAFCIDGADAGERVKLREVRLKNDAFQSLDEAQIILAGGYGLGSKENFQLLYQLAERLNAAIGASRKAVDAGWAPAAIQIGQTGKTVSPELYIAFGISGALQHTLGMNKARRTIAINSDPAAPILGISDVPILGDAPAVIRKMLRLMDEGYSPLSMAQAIASSAQ